MMANPLFNGFGNNPIMQIMKDIQDFQRTFKGDPKAEVERMMKDGRLTQEKFNELSQIANQIMAVMPK